MTYEYLHTVLLALGALRARRHEHNFACAAKTVAFWTCSKRPKVFQREQNSILLVGEFVPLVGIFASAVRAFQFSAAVWEFGLRRLKKV
jgi:hypothetical protein